MSLSRLRLVAQPGMGCPAFFERVISPSHSPLDTVHSHAKEQANEIGIQVFPENCEQCSLSAIAIYILKKAEVFVINQQHRIIDLKIFINAINFISFYMLILIQYINIVISLCKCYIRKYKYIFEGFMCIYIVYIVSTSKKNLKITISHCLRQNLDD